MLVINYIFHHLVLLPIAISGFYSQLSPWRFFFLFFIASLQAQFWMAPPVARIMRSIISPQWFADLFLMKIGTSHIPPAPTAKDSAKGLPDSPMPWTLAALTVSLVLAANTGLALPKALQSAFVKGDKAWGKASVCWLVPLHTVSLLVAGLSAYSVWPVFQKVVERIPKAERKYEPRFDNVKVFLTTFIAVGHTMDFWLASTATPLPVLVFRIFEEWWIMPAYAYISGFLSTPEPTTKRMHTLLTSVGFVYILMQVFWLSVPSIFLLAANSIGTRVREVVIANGMNLDWNYSFTIWSPFGVMWYLIVLFQWRLMAPYWKQLTYPLSCAIAVMCLMPYTIIPVADYCNATFLAWDRLWSCLPLYVLGFLTRYISSAAAEVANWPGMKVASLGALLTSLLCNMINVASAFGYSSFSFYDTMDWTSTLPATAYFNMEMVDAQVVSGARYHDSYSSGVFYVAWYGPLCAVFGKMVLILSILALTSNEYVTSVFGFPFELTERGKDSIVNYLLHMVTLNALALTGIFNSFTLWRSIVAIIFAVVQAQFWMWKPVATGAKWLLIFPPWFHFLLKQEN